jgi:hypothetical protein
MYGSVVNKLRPGPADLPTFAVLDEIDVHTHNELARSFLGSAHAPFIMQPLKDKDAVTRMLTPQLEVPAFDKNADLLKLLDTKLRRLDTQDGAVAGAHHDHMAAAPGAKPDGVAMAQRSKLYFASLDGTVAPRALAGGVCYCCKTAIVTAADGLIFAAWRHVYPGNIRDIAFTMSRDGGKTFAAPQRVSEDKWVLEGCPDDGPAMAVDATNRVHLVWPTLITEKTAEHAENAEKKGSLNNTESTIALFYATSADGKRFTPRRRIPTQGMPHHPQIAIGGDGSLAIAWDEGANGRRRVAMVRTTVDIAAGAVPARTVVSDSAVYPVVAVTREATLLAWTSGPGPASVIRVERVTKVAGAGS